MMRLGAVVMLAWAGTAVAQSNPEPAPERLLIGQGSLIGAPRVVGLGGAYMAVAEHAEGFPTNTAALAHRAPNTTGNWSFDGMFSMLDLPLGNPESRDLDNDGRPDQARTSRQFIGGGMLQIRRFGIGGYYRTATRSYCATLLCPANDYLEADMGNAAIGAAFSFFHDDLIIGAAAQQVRANFSYRNDAWYYEGWGGQLDFLYRPNSLPLRVGGSFRPEIEAHYRPAQSGNVLPGGKPIHASMVMPGFLSFGVAMRLGEGAYNYNRLSPKARQVMLKDVGPERTPPEVRPDAPDGRWLIAMQADLLFPTKNAVPASTFTTLSFDQPAPVPEELTVVPRLGIENETFPGRFRLRAGTYFEPSMTSGKSYRIHGTGGAELRLFWYFTIYAAVDFASRYQYISAGISFWQGPRQVVYDEDLAKQQPPPSQQPPPEQQLAPQIAPPTDAPPPEQPPQANPGEGAEKNRYSL